MTAQTNATSNPTPTTNPQVINFYERPSDAYDIMAKRGNELSQRNPVKYVESNWLDTNAKTGKLKFDLTSAPICFSMDFWEWIDLVLKPQLTGEFEGLLLMESYFKYPDEYQVHNLESPWFETIVLCYQTDADNNVIETAHDLEISIQWHKDMTDTDDVTLIEKLLSDMCEEDFDIEQLNGYLALIGNPDE